MNSVDCSVYTLDWTIFNILEWNTGGPQECAHAHPPLRCWYVPDRGAVQGGKSCELLGQTHVHMAMVSSKKRVLRS